MDSRSDTMGVAALYETFATTGSQRALEGALAAFDGPRGSLLGGFVLDTAKALTTGCGGTGQLCRRALSFMLTCMEGRPAYCSGSVRALVPSLVRVLEHRTDHADAVADVVSACVVARRARGAEALMNDIIAPLLEAMRPQNAVVQSGAARCLGRAIFCSRRPDMVQLQGELTPRLLRLYEASAHSEARAMMLCAMHNLAKHVRGDAIAVMAAPVTAGAVGAGGGVAEKVAAFELLEILANATCAESAAAGTVIIWKGVIEKAGPLATSALNPLVRRAAGGCLKAARDTVVRLDAAAAELLARPVFDGRPLPEETRLSSTHSTDARRTCAHCAELPLVEVLARLRLSPGEDAALRERLCVCDCACAAALSFPLCDLLAKRVLEWALEATSSDEAERLLAWLSELGSLHRAREGFLSSTAVAHAVAALFVLTGRAGGPWQGVRRDASRLLLAFRAPLGWLFHEIERDSLAT